MSSKREPLTVEERRCLRVASEANCTNDDWSADLYVLFLRLLDQVEGLEARLAEASIACSTPYNNDIGSDEMYMRLMNIKKMCSGQ